MFTRIVITSSKNCLLVFEPTSRYILPQLSAYVSINLNEMLIRDKRERKLDGA